MEKTIKLYEQIIKKMKQFVDKYHKRPTVDDIKVVLETDETRFRRIFTIIAESIQQYLAS